MRNFAILIVAAVCAPFCACQTQAATSLTRTNVIGEGSSFAGPVYQNLAFYYRFVDSDVVVSYSSSSSAVGRESMLSHKAHFCGTDTPFSRDERFILKENLFSFPVVLSAIGIGRNPSLAPVSAVVVIPRRVLIRIFGPLLVPGSGGRTPFWDDPEIAQANPGLALPRERIRVVVRSDMSGTSEALKLALKKIAESIGVTAWTDVSEAGTWPISAQDMVAVTGSSAVIAAVVSVPYSIAALSQNLLTAGGVPLVALTNAKTNAPLLLTPAAVSTAAAKSTYDVNTLNADPADVDPDGTGWPLMSATYVVMPQSFTTAPRTADDDAAAAVSSTLVLRDCSVPKALAQFFSWGFTNELATQATLTLGSPPPFEIVRRIILGLNLKLTCNGEQASSGAGFSIISGGSAAEVSMRKALSAFTALQTHKLTGIYRNEGSSATVALLKSRDADVGMIEQPMDSGDLARLQLIQFPLLHVPIAIVFNLPGLSGIVPLKLSVEALTEIFAGRVTHWSHPLILRDNRESIGSISTTAPFVPVVRSDSSGTTGTVAAVFAADAARRGVTFPPGASNQPNWPASFTLRVRAGDVAATVKANPFSIGFMPVAAAIESGARMAWMVSDSDPVGMDPAKLNQGEAWPIMATVYVVIKGAVNATAVPSIPIREQCTSLGWALDSLVYLITSGREILSRAYTELAPVKELRPFLEAIHSIACGTEPLNLRTALCPAAGGKRCSGRGRCSPVADAEVTVACACDLHYSGSACEIYTAPPLLTRSPVAMAVGISLGLAACLAVVVITLYVTRKKADVWMVPREDIHIEELLARGGYSAVFKGTWRATEVAIKAMPMKATDTFDPFLCLLQTDPLFEVWAKERGVDAGQEQPNKSGGLRTSGALRQGQVVPIVQPASGGNAAASSAGPAKPAAPVPSQQQYQPLLKNSVSGSLRTSGPLPGAVPPTSSPLNPSRTENKPMITPNMKSGITTTPSGWTGRRLLSRFSSRSGTGTAKSSSAGTGRSSRGGMGNAVRSEISIIARLRHPNISFLIAASASNGFVFLVMDNYKYGSLFQLLRNPEMDLLPSARLRLALDSAKGLMFLHSQNPPVLHMDLKSPNILVSAQMTAAITDFGLSSISSRRVQLGTLPWAAPEVLSDSPYTMASDIFSLGVVLWELAQMSAQVPWQGKNPAAIREAVLLRQRPFLDRELCPLGPAYADLISRCWSHNPVDRPSAKQVLQALQEVAEAGNASALDAKWSADARRAVLSIRGLPEVMRHDASSGVAIRPYDIPDCSLIFTDIVGFTKWSSERTAGEVAETLHLLHNEAFGKLVADCHAHHLETIGDAYIVSVNFPVKLKTSHHAVAVRLGLAMAAACAPFGINIRVGIAGGPATASVVGSTNPKLTLLGDTVNLAARLESKCPPGGVLVSKATRDALVNDPAFAFSPGDEIELKGKGRVLCFVALGYARDIDSNPDIVSEAGSIASRASEVLRSPGPRAPRSHNLSGSLQGALLRKHMSNTDVKGFIV